MMAILGAVAAIANVFLLIDGKPSYAAAPAVLLLLVLALPALDTHVAQRQIDRHGGDVHAALEDDETAAPVIPVKQENPYAHSGITRGSLAA